MKTTLASRVLDKIKDNPSLIFLYLIVLIPVLTMAFFLISDYSYRQEEEIKKNEQMARVLAENLDSYLENVKSTLVSLSTLPPVQQKNRSEIEEIFQSLLISDHQVSLYWAADINGKILGKYPSKWPDKTDTNFIKTVLKDETYVSEPRKGAITGMEIITISTLIKDQKGKTIGVIGASIPLENLQKKFSLKVGSTGFPILVTKSGQFLVHPKREEISKKISLDDPIFHVINKGGSGTLDIVAPFDQKRKFFSYVPLKEANWIVLVIQPLSEFHAKTLALFTSNGVIILLVVSIIALASYYLMLYQRREEEARILQAEKLSLVGQLAAGMAHEIRNPLTSIKGLAQLAATREDRLASDHLQVIVNEVDRIEGIIKETLLLAKPNPVAFKNVNMKRLLEEVCILMKPQANQKAISFELLAEENLPTIMGEPNQLKQVFINIIKNSIEAAPDSGGKIVIELVKADQKLIITVKDNGCGINPNIIHKLGSPFISTKENGTGLGLMVTYRIVQNHSGKIKVTSAKECGTTVTVELSYS